MHLLQHTPNLVAWHHSFYGLVRGIVQVTHDAASPPAHRARLVQIDTDGGKRTVIVNPGIKGNEKEMPSTITVKASSPGLKSAMVNIPLTTDAAQHSVLASAARSVAGGGGDTTAMQWLE